MLTTVIKPNTYQDSVSLMRLSQQLTAFDGVTKVSVMMGTGTLIEAADFPTEYYPASA